MSILVWIVLLFALFLPVTAAPKPLQSFKNCTLVRTPWADGDSFLVKTPDQKEFTVRLYGADCVELHVSTDSDKRRQRDQRRHFGITNVKGDAANSVELATSFGKKASEFTIQELKAPFTIHTRMSRALGDGRHERFYAFVETANGKDLSTELVSNGLARARGAATDGPGGRSSARYKENLSDLELQAAKRGHGIWKYTNWDSLPDERDDQRKEEEEDQIAVKDILPKDFHLNPNTASRDDLDRLPGIGPTLADRILETREDTTFEEPKDLLRVPSIKQKTLDKFLRYLDFKVP